MRCQETHRGHDPTLAKPQIVAKETLSGDSNCAGARTNSSLSSFDHALQPDDNAFLCGSGFRCWQTFAVSGFYGLSGGADRHSARPDKTTRRLPTGFSHVATF